MTRNTKVQVDSAVKQKKVRKSTSKKSGTKMATVSPDKCFWVNNGPICKNLPDLYNAAKTMSDEQFAYHTKRNGNDFANWVRDVIGDSLCAVKIAKVKTRAGMLRALSSVKK
jgi:hypothetical protein